MPRATLTDRLLRSLAKRGTGGPAQLDYRDTSLPIEWGVRVTRDGLVTYFYRYRTAGGTRRRLKLGQPYPITTLAEATQLAIDAARAVARGEDPAQRSRRDGLDVAGLAEIYVERYARHRRRRWEHLRYVLDRFVVAELGGRGAAEVSRADIRQLLEAPLDRGSGYMANEVLAAARAMYRWALSEDLVPADPTAGIRPPTPVKPRQRVLKPEEIRALWLALDQDAGVVARALQFGLLVPVRRGSLLGGSFDELRGDEWLIPRARFKSGVDFLAFVPPAAREVLDRVPRPPRERLFFPSPLRSGKPIGGWLQASDRAREVAGLEDFRPHDLRRCWATYARREGVTAEVVAACLGHAPRGVTRRHYDLYGLHEEKRAAFERMAEAFMRMVTDPGLMAVR